MLAPTKHRFSVKEYYRMAETGVLKPDARVELLNGGITDMSPIGPFHEIGRASCRERVNKARKGRWWECIQDPVHLDDHSETEPNLMLLKRDPGSYTSRN